MHEHNTLSLSGVVNNISLSHTHLNENFYSYTLEVPRLSGNSDLLPAVISERLLHNNDVNVGDYITVTGQLRTRNVRTPERNKLLVFAYAQDVALLTEEAYNAIEDKNVLTYQGFLTRKPNSRETKSGRKIAELLVASNRKNNKSDYIPTIAWGVDAIFASKLLVGDKLLVKGRFQSREYMKRGNDGTPVSHMAYEVSVTMMNISTED